MLLLVIDFHDQYKTIHCKSTNKSSVCNKLYLTYDHSLDNINQFIDKSPKTSYSVLTSWNYIIKLLQFFSFYLKMTRPSTLKPFSMKCCWWKEENNENPINDLIKMFKCKARNHFTFYLTEYQLDWIFTILKLTPVVLWN